MSGASPPPALPPGPFLLRDVTWPQAAWDRLLASTSEVTPAGSQLFKASSPHEVRAGPSPEGHCKRTARHCTQRASLKGACGSAWLRWAQAFF